MSERMLDTEKRARNDSMCSIETHTQHQAHTQHTPHTHVQAVGVDAEAQILVRPQHVTQHLGCRLAARVHVGAQQRQSRPQRLSTADE